MGRFQGIGTDYYGKKDYNRQDGAYTAIKWFVLFLLPVIPLKSYRLRKLGQYTDRNYVVYRQESIRYQILSEGPLDWGLVAKTYLSVYGFIALLVGSFVLCASYPDNANLIIIPFGLIAGLIIWYLAKHWRDKV